VIPVLIDNPVRIRNGPAAVNRYESQEVTDRKIGKADE